VSRRLLLVLILYFATDFAVPFEPGPGRFVIEDMEDAVTAPRELPPEASAASRPPARLITSAASRPRPVSRVTRREWQTPPPRRELARPDRPAPPDAH